MKKTFFQLHAGFLFITFLFLIFFLFGLLAVIVGFSSEFDGQIASRLLVIPGGFFGWQLVFGQFMHHGIIA